MVKLEDNLTFEKIGFSYFDIDNTYEVYTENFRYLISVSLYVKPAPIEITSISLSDKHESELEFKIVNTVGEFLEEYFENKHIHKPYWIELTGYFTKFRRSIIIDDILIDI